MRNNKLINNTISSLLLQVVTIICGFILPRLILSHYGSEVNGLVNSINQFLHVIAFLDLGVGAVFQSSLYKPLADNDVVSQSKIYASGQKFFTKLAQILLIYVAVLVIVFPVISNQQFDFLYTAVLIVSISISSFAQYYFGMANSLFLIADQKGYIGYNVQIITLILNTLLCYILINLGASIHSVKLTTSCVYLIRPLFLNYYVNKHYRLNKKIQYDSEPIKQKWNGLAQHIAFVVLDSTDTVVLTIFSTMQNVSIYSVYFLVISGLKQLFNATTNGIQALLGELYAKRDTENLNMTFSITDWTIHTITTLVFGCTYVLIIPFVMTYTRGVEDANYFQPLFSGLLVFAYAMYCYRLPYHIIIKASAHYRETQSCYFFAAVLNIVISVIFVNWWGLIGVAIGTAVAMTYQTLWMVWYDSKHLIEWPAKKFIKQIFTDIIVVIISSIISSFVSISQYTYLSWIMMAVKILLVWIGVSFIVNLMLYKSYIKLLLSRVFRRIL